MLLPLCSILLFWCALSDALTGAPPMQVYITMSKSEKTESKAAVDLIGAYFGKSGASWIMQV